MNITPVSYNQKSPNFNGRIILRGGWNKKLSQEFLENPEVQKLANGAYDIIGKMSRKTASYKDASHPNREKLYQLTLLARKEKQTFLERIKNLFEPSKQIRITKHYHTEGTLLYLMEERLKKDNLAKRLGI